MTMLGRNLRRKGKYEMAQAATQHRVAQDGEAKKPRPAKRGEKAGAGYRYLKLGEIAHGDVLSPADDPIASRSVYHLLVPVAAITCEPEDLAMAKTADEAKAIKELAAHLKESMQLFPCRLVRMLAQHVENTSHISDRDGCLYGVVSGMRIILATVEAGLSHVRAEVLPARPSCWPSAIMDDPSKCREYERRLAGLYFGRPAEGTTDG